MRRTTAPQDFRRADLLEEVGLSTSILATGLEYTYELLDTIDLALISRGESRLAATIELANLSAMIGNLLRSGISKASNGLFANNSPHTFPDLLHANNAKSNVEIKIALEDNNPKGHLAKEGYHLTCRYVLGQADGRYDRAARGNVVWVWELRFGLLQTFHFNLSNTTGDSGKTAVINAAGLKALTPVYCCLPLCPISPDSRRYRELVQIFSKESDPPPPVQ